MDVTERILDSLKSLIGSVRIFFRRLQWRLTLSYALFTAVAAFVFGVIGVAFLWYLTFWSWMPTGVASDLLRSGQVLSKYLDVSPPDVLGLNEWLLGAIDGGDLVIGSPMGSVRPEGPYSPPPPPPDRFGQVVAVAVVDAAGRVAASYPVGYFMQGAPLSVPDEAVRIWHAALEGKRNPSELAVRSRAGDILAAAPIMTADRRRVGAIFIETTPAIQEWSLLQNSVRQTIVPVVLCILAVGIVAGVFFGYFIARGLTGRLGTLAAAADAWSQGDFDVIVADESGDELGQLAARFNHMAMQLQTLLQTRQQLAMLDERNRLARDLHDAVKQQVFATAMQVGAALALYDRDPATAKSHLAETDRLVRQTQQELTALIQELRPAMLEDKGLTTALREYAADWSRQNDVVAEVRVRGEQTTPFLLEQTLFRVAQEALANTARHSGATLVEIHLGWEDDWVTLMVSDNGRGFNLTTGSGEGIGLASMRERVEGVGGHIEVTSWAGEGTRVAVRCPMPKT